MYGWPVVSMGLCRKKDIQTGIAVSVIIGFILLPMVTYDVPILPRYTKSTSIAIGILLGSLISGRSAYFPCKFSALDIPMILYCIISPIMTSLSNNLGIYNGLSDTVDYIMSWGIFFWIGRKYFGSPESLRVLTRTILIGGMIYFPLVLYEVRMSPQLSNIFYGFFPHSFMQGMRYGGFRPLVFMKHFLMVSFWMAITATIACWFWKFKELDKVAKIPVWLICLSLIGVTILCKSANGWMFVAIGAIAPLYYKRTRSTSLFKMLLIVVPLYITARLSGIISMESVASLFGKVFDAERIESLSVRLLQEDLFGARAMQRALLGWGGFGRGWPIDPYTGEQLIGMVDSLWILAFSTHGLVGLISMYLSIGLGPWKVLTLLKRSRRNRRSEADEPFAIDAIVLSLILCFFLLDSLMNAMASPVYILCSGALVSYYLNRRGRNASPSATTKSEAI